MAYRSISLNSTPASPLVVTAPSGIADGDLLIAYAMTDDQDPSTFTLTGFTNFTGMPHQLPSVTSDGAVVWAAWKIAASESGNYSISNDTNRAMIGGVVCLQTITSINRQILANQDTEQASVWTMTAGSYSSATDATCTEVFIGFADNSPSGTVSFSTPSGFTMRAGATGQSDGTFYQCTVATKDDVASGATGGVSCTGTLAAGTAGWSVLLTAVEQSGGGGGGTVVQRTTLSGLGTRAGSRGIQFG